MKSFLSDHLFESSPVNLEDPLVMRNLAEPGIGKIVFDSFKSAINDLTIQESGTTTIEARIQLRHTRPFRTNRRSFLPSDKSVFNFIVGEAGHDKFEIEFAAFLENAPDVQAYAKNYFAVGFRMDYVKENGDLSHYTPDFIARDQRGKIWIIETKGRREIDLPQKMSRLAQWCRDATEASEEEEYNFIFVDQESFQKSRPSDFHDLATSFQEFKS